MNAEAGPSRRRIIDVPPSWLKRQRPKQTTRASIAERVIAKQVERAEPQDDEPD